MSCCVARKCGLLLAGTLLCVPCLPFLASPAMAREANAGRANGISVGVCSQHPELFKLRRLHADEAMRVIRPTGEHFTVIGFESGYVVSGECARFIKTFGNGIVLTNNAAFRIENLAFVSAPSLDLSDGPPPSALVPPKNVRSIASDRFAAGSGRNYVKHQGDIVLWSGKKGSAIGIVPCAGDSRVPCQLDHLILSSPYQIRDFAWVPPLHESHYGGLWLQIALPRGEKASVRYSVWFWQEL